MQKCNSSFIVRKLYCKIIVYIVYYLVLSSKLLLIRIVMDWLLTGVFLCLRPKMLGHTVGQAVWRMDGW